jgi:hypothetical protein
MPAFQAGGGRRAKEEVARELQSALTPLGKAFIDFCEDVSALAESQQVEEEQATDRAAEDEAAPAREAAAPASGARFEACEWDEPINHVRTSAASTQRPLIIRAAAAAAAPAAAAAAARSLAKPARDPARAFVTSCPHRSP